MQLESELATRCDVHAGVDRKDIRLVTWCVSDQIVVKDTAVVPATMYPTLQ